MPPGRGSGPPARRWSERARGQARFRRSCRVGMVSEAAGFGHQRRGRRRTFGTAGSSARAQYLSSSGTGGQRIEQFAVPRQSLSEQLLRRRRGSPRPRSARARRPCSASTCFWMLAGPRRRRRGRPAPAGCPRCPERHAGRAAAGLQLQQAGAQGEQGCRPDCRCPPPRCTRGAAASASACRTSCRK